MPRCFVAHPNMGRGVERGAVVERAVGHVNPITGREDREQQRAAMAAMDVMGVVAAVALDVRLAARHAQRLPGDAAERFERRARRAPAVRAVAILGVGEGIGHFEADRAAITAAVQDARSGHGGRKIGSLLVWQ